MQPTKQLPKEEREKKGWHLPFPWLWNPTGSKLFEVLFREETVIASILKRGGKCHYTRITVAVTSAEKASELAASRGAGRRARNRKRKVCVCQQHVARVGRSVPGDPKKRRGVPFLHMVSSDCSFSQFPLLLYFPYSSNSRALLKGNREHPGFRAVKLMKVSGCWVESLQRNVMTQCPRCSPGELWAHSVTVAGDSDTKNM